MSCPDAIWVKVSKQNDWERWKCTREEAAAGRIGLMLSTSIPSCGGVKCRTTDVRLCYSRRSLCYQRKGSKGVLGAHGPVGAPDLGSWVTKLWCSVWGLSLATGALQACTAARPCKLTLHLASPGIGAYCTRTLVRATRRSSGLTLSYVPRLIQ
jgi:hypothetical protein